MPVPQRLQLMLAGLALCLALPGCGHTPEAQSHTGPRPLPEGFEARSLSGRALMPAKLKPEVLTKREAKLAEARARYMRNPTDTEAIIWLGRRTAYLGRYRNAVEIFTKGLAINPQSAPLLRHRGHRHITLRHLDLAITDLEKAAKEISGKPDVIEQDGLPNARGIPTGTLQSNIWYHLGLAYYLTDDLKDALRCYRQCLKVSGNPDMLCATSHWLYMTLRRLGQTQEAADVLMPIHANLDVIENHAYHRLLLMYKGELTPSEVLGSETSDGIKSATAGYGVANWHVVCGRERAGAELLRQITSGKEWAAFGHIAAEADVQRLGRRGQ